MPLSHIIFINRQFSNAWLCKCSCGELFTGKGQTYPIAVRKHLFETLVLSTQEVAANG